MSFKKYGLDLLSVVALGIGSIVGAGIFALLGQVIVYAGEWTYLSFAIGGVIAMLCGYSYAKLAGAYPGSGGLTDYFHIAYPKKWMSGTLTIIYWLASAVSVCMMAKSFGIYINDLLPKDIQGALFINSFAVVLIVALGFLNMLSSGDVGKTETVLVAVKLGILALLIAAAFYGFVSHGASYPVHHLPVSFKQFMTSVGITFFAYAGFGVITNAAADVKNPKLTIARAIYWTLTIVILLYISLAFVVLANMPMASLLKNANTAVALVAEQILGKAGYVLIYGAAIIAFMTGISATFFSIFRISQALAQDGVLPRFYERPFLGKGSWGNLLTISVTAWATAAFDFSAIVNFSSAAFLVSYLAVFGANWLLREKTKAYPPLVVGGFLMMLFVLVGFLFSLS